MAYSAGTVWELRFAGNLNNGGGFDSSFGGTDYSQQNSPQLTVNDAACAASTTLTSVTGGFTSQMVGNVVNVVTVGLFQITAFTNSNTVTIDRNGGTFSGKTANVGGARTVSTQGTENDITPVAGNKFWMKGDGTYQPLTNAPTLAASGTVTQPITLECYATTRGDGGQATLQWNAGAINLLSVTGNFRIVKNLILDGAGGSTTLLCSIAGNHCTLQGMTAKNGKAGIVSATGIGTYGRNCLFDGKGVSTDVLQVNGSSRWVDCEIANAGASNSNIGVFGSGDHSLINCISRNSANEGLYVDTAFSGQLLVQQCDLWNNGRDGFRVYSTAGGLQGIALRGNIIGRSGAYDINYIPSDLTNTAGVKEWVATALENNAYFTTGTARYHQLPASVSDIVLLANPFVDDTTTFNFQLNNVAGGGAVLLATPWQVGWTDGVNLGLYPYGALGSNVQAAVARQFNQGAPVIDEVQFPPLISRGLKGGASYNTIVVTTSGGSEQRVGLWTRPRYKWEISNSPKQPSEMQQIMSFFQARNGRLRGFRFKDWADFTATNEPLAPTGANTVQLIKTYTSGPNSVVRNIYKPVASPAVTLLRNGGTFTAFSLDTTTGLVSPAPDSTATITAITQAATAQVTTSAAHGFTVGQTIYFSGVLGMTQINGLTGVVQTVPTGTTFTVNINSTTFSAYTSGGTVAKYIQPGESLTWTGQFDTPVRFDVDDLAVVMDDVLSWSLDNVPIVEIRS